MCHLPKRHNPSTLFWQLSFFYFESDTCACTCKRRMRSSQVGEISASCCVLFSFILTKCLGQRTLASAWGFVVFAFDLQRAELKTETWMERGIEREGEGESSSVCWLLWCSPLFLSGALSRPRRLPPWFALTQDRLRSLQLAHVFVTHDSLRSAERCRQDLAEKHSSPARRRL